MRAIHYAVEDTDEERLIAGGRRAHPLRAPHIAGSHPHRAGLSSAPRGAGAM